MIIRIEKKSKTGHQYFKVIRPVPILDNLEMNFISANGRKCLPEDVVQMEFRSPEELKIKLDNCCKIFSLTYKVKREMEYERLTIGKRYWSRWSDCEVVCMSKSKMDCQFEDEEGCIESHTQFDVNKWICEIQDHPLETI